MSRRVAAETPAGTMLPAAGSRTAAFGLSAAPALALAATATVWFAVRGIDHSFISFSDGVYMYAASVAAAHGAHALYDAVALSLPPGAVLGTALLWKLSPHVETVRLALAVLGALTAVLTYRVGRTVFGLGPWTAALAAVVALTGPVRAQFVGLDGEVVLAPLLLALALALERRALAASAALLGFGFFFKLTWAPFFVAGLVAVALRDGRRTVLKVGAGALLVAAGLYAIALQTFAWSAHDLLAQLVLAESHSGFQLGLLPGIAAVVVVLWWPLLLLAATGLRAAPRTARLLIGAGAICGLAMLKQGTFFNVLAPLEPFLAITAVAGGVALWRRGHRRARTIVLVCALGIAVHVASVSSGGLAHSLPLPLGAALVNVDNQRDVDRIAAAVDAHSRPDQAVLVNPFFALIAHRREPGDAADWFILSALERYCAGKVDRASHCTQWARVKALARSHRLPLVSVDTNVVSFDESFRRDTGVAAMHRLIGVDAPPIKTALFSR